jgi:catechol 2,3-dioxygenase-like lactoylglutathione lyase family enzyme
MGNALVPELAVSDWQFSKNFYCNILGFSCDYERPEDGFCYLSLDGAELMIDQIGVGRTFDDGHLPRSYPFGKGLNVQIRIASVDPLIRTLTDNGIALYLPLEDHWYRQGEEEVGSR